MINVLSFSERVRKMEGSDGEGEGEEERQALFMLICCPSPKPCLRAQVCTNTVVSIRSRPERKYKTYVTKR